MVHSEKKKSFFTPLKSELTDYFESFITTVIRKNLPNLIPSASFRYKRKVKFLKNCSVDEVENLLHYLNVTITQTYYSLCHSFMLFITSHSRSKFNVSSKLYVLHSPSITIC